MASSPRPGHADGKVGPTGSAKRESVSEKLEVGVRVRVDNAYVKCDDGETDVLGTVRFFGTPSFAGGIWVGVELDLALGKNDGSVQGVQYFQCTAGHGIFVRRKAVKPIDGNFERSSSSIAMEEKRSPPRSSSKSTRRFSMMDMPTPTPEKRGVEPEEEDTLAAFSHIVEDGACALANAVDSGAHGIIDYWKRATASPPQEGNSSPSGDSAWYKVVNMVSGTDPADKSSPRTADADGGRGEIRSSPLKEMGEKVQSMLQPNGNFGASDDSCSDTDSDIIVEEPALQAFRQAAQRAVEEGTRGLFEAVLQFHRALAEQAGNIEKLQGTVSQLRRDLAARDRRPQARDTILSPSRAGKALPCVAHGAQVLHSSPQASPQAWQPVEVQGIVGKNAERLNGTYRPTATVINGCTAFEKDGDRDTWFCFDSQHSRWKVQRESARGSDRGWLSSQRTDAPHPVVEGSWNVWMGSEWEVQSSVTVRFIQDSGSGGARGSQAAAAEPATAPPPERITPSSPAAKRSARRGSTLDLAACLDRSGAGADAAAADATGNIRADGAASAMRGVYRRCSAMEGAPGGPAAEQRQVAGAGLAAEAAAAGRDLYVDSVTKMTEMYVRNLTEFSEKRLQLNRVCQDARHKALEQVIWGPAEDAMAPSESV